ncbi:unnamed protein product [Owenia fusiformis]|uniref:Uncharacterized protein n=1 Tax=Owenia fusiformis TaxID=6347 RepID=A0A8J1Y1X4_OWEFU|nr:unnamed protein product [Owenia fusiformis]
MEVLQNDTENVDNSTNDIQSTYELLQSNKGFIIYMAIIFVCGVIGNAIIIRVYWKRQKHHASATKSFIKTLAVTDLLLCVLIIPYSIIFELHLIHNLVLCKVFEFIRHFMIAQALLTMVGVAIERYFAICHPLKHFSRLLGRVIITGCTLVSFLTALPILFTYELHYINGQAHCDMPLEHTRHGYGVFLTIGFLGMIVTTVVLYGLVYKVVLQRALRWRKKVQPINTSQKRKDGDDNMKSSCISLPNRIENCTSPSCLNCSMKTNSRSEYTGDEEDKKKTVDIRINNRENQYIAHTSSYNEPLSNQNSGKIESEKPIMTTKLHPSPQTTENPNKINESERMNRPMSLEINSDLTGSMMPKLKSAEIGRYSRFLQPPPMIRKKSLWIEDVPLSPSSPQTPNCKTLPQDTKTKTNWLTKPHYTTAGMLFGVTIIFIISWIPFWLIKFQLLSYSNVLNYTFLINHASNAIVYFLCNKRVRNDIVKCILCKL